MSFTDNSQIDTGDTRDQATWALGVAIATAFVAAVVWVSTALVCQSGWLSSQVAFAELWAVSLTVMSAFLLSELYEVVSSFFEYIAVIPILIVASVVEKEESC